MKRVWMMVLALALSAMIMAGCAAAETAPVPAPEATEQPRPSHTELTEIMNALEWTENPSFQQFRTVTLTGETIDQTVFAGHKVTMINIWGTFCNPCIQEMPALSQLSGAYEEGEFQVIGLVLDMLDTDGSIHPMAVETAWAIIDATGADYRHILPTYDMIAAKLQYVSSVPETIFVDSQGNLLTPEGYVGARSYEDWKAIVDGLLAEAPEVLPDAA